MNYLSYSLLFVILTLSFNSFSETIFVSTNSDSGVGSFREALKKAGTNGNTEMDIIWFNIPGNTINDRTIEIYSALPFISSNIIIDGTTQPGLKFGASDAKICLKMLYVETNRGFLAIKNETAIQIFGLYIDLRESKSNNPYAIKVEAGNNIIIGEAGKGNLIRGGWISVKNSENDEEVNLSKDIKISSNILGLSENGELFDDFVINLSFEKVKNLTIGGEIPLQGNLINGNIHYNDYPISAVVITSMGDLLIANNRFGVNLSDTKIDRFRIDVNNPSNPGFDGIIDIGGGYLENFYFKNNQVCGNNYLKVSTVRPFKITGNKFGTDKTGNQILGLHAFAIYISYSLGGGIIGGSLKEDGNIIAGTFSSFNYNKYLGAITNLGTRRVSLLNNTFKCNSSTIPYLINAAGFPINAPSVQISSRSTTHIEGKATPKSRVDLYYSINCNFCEPEQLFASITADNNGDWTYSDALKNHNIIACSTLNETTSEFTIMQFTYQTNDLKIQMVCDGIKGSISGLKFINATKYGWYDESGNLISKTIDLKDINVGKYTFLISDDYCSLSSEVFEIKDVSIISDLKNVKIKPATCGMFDGSITGIESTGNQFSWRDQNNYIYTYYDTKDLVNFKAGTYTLTVSSSTSCSKEIGTFTIPLIDGLVLDEKNIKIVPSTCGLANGSIQNIAIAGKFGTLSYSWKNRNNQLVGNTKDLIDVKSGFYKLEVKDGAGCSLPIYSSEIEIKSLYEINIDESTASTKSSNCEKATGAITGISVNGATKFTWFNEDGLFIKETINPELFDVPGGKYKLKASNNNGCLKESEFYSISQPKAIPFPEYGFNIKYPCGNFLGEISMIYNSNAAPKLIEWKDESGKIISQNTTLLNINAGIYKLYLTDINSCAVLYRIFNINKITPLKISTSGIVVKNDKCGKKMGSITGLKVSEGYGKYQFIWRNEKGNISGRNLSLNELNAGKYTLEVSDSTNCIVTTNPITIYNDQVALAAPLVQNISICAPGDVLIKAEGKTEAIYKLYENEFNGYPIQQNTSGLFSINVKTSKDFYVSYADGECESSRSKINVEVSDENLISINSFTPNGDGVNDLWIIKGIENYPKAKVKIYNRYGALVFESTGYHHPFDGTRQGNDLPQGTYYFILELKEGCRLINGSLSIIR